MDPLHLEENLAAVLKDVNKVRPKRTGKFITRTLLTSPPSGEVLKINPFLYISEEYIATSKSQANEEVEDNEEQQAEAKN